MELFIRDGKQSHVLSVHISKCYLFIGLIVGYQGEPLHALSALWFVLAILNILSLFSFFLNNLLTMSVFLFFFKAAIYFVGDAGWRSFVLI